MREFGERNADDVRAALEQSGHAES
jgi:hypothetical protein